MSYHYRIEPSIVIIGDKLTGLKRHLNLDNNSLFGLSDELSKQGYPTLPEGYSPEEVKEITGESHKPWEWKDGLGVHNVGWTPEHEGTQGIANRFVKFAEFVGYNFEDGEYSITDEYNRVVTIIVANNGCTVIHGK